MKKTIVLDEDFNEPAKELADIQKAIETIKKKLDEFNKEAKVNINRLSMYIMNQFYNSYKFDKDYILFRRDDKIEFQKIDDVELARKKFEELKEEDDDTWLLDELDMITEDGFVISLEDISEKEDSDLEDRYKEYDNIKKYLPKTKKVFEINKKQKKELKELFFNCNNPKYKFLIDKLESFQGAYLDIVDMILEMIDEKGYEFDIETDDVITARDDKDMTWHILISTEEG